MALEILLLKEFLIIGSSKLEKESQFYKDVDVK